MNISKTYLLTALSLLFIHVPMWGQLMYPGDVNDNGIANTIDVLFVGQAFSSTGPERNGASTNWIPQDISDNLWGQTFGNGLDYAYADCNGDGVINEEDIEEGIEENFLEEHGIISPDVFTSDGEEGVDPSFAVIADKEVLFSLDTLNIDIQLGSGSLPIDEFYGIAFTVRFDASMIEDEEAKFELDLNPWYDPSGTESVALVVEDLDNGRIDVAITRTTQSGINGSGSLGTLNFVIIEDVVGESIEVDSLVAIENIKVIDGNWADVQVYDTLEVMTTSVQQVWEPEWRIFPNPATELVYVEVGDLNIQAITITNTLGQEVKRHLPKFQEAIIPVTVGQLPAGTYYLSVYTDRGRWVKKLTIPY